MNDADKSRYLREKEAYERVTGQALPAPKVTAVGCTIFLNTRWLPYICFIKLV
jgi:hypothetical protein